MISPENNICVYTMTHGPVCEILPDYCTPLELGAELRTDFNYDLRDNIGDDNISQKDKLYCELTGLYWLWKNDAHKITGLTHYRRIFPIDKIHVEKVLETHDIILPLFIHMKISCEEQYISAHIKLDWEIMCDTLMEMYPEYYASAKRIFNKKRLIPCNMFIAKRDVIDRYCSWLFPLLFAIEPKLDMSNRSNYQSRVIGFMAERLFTLWVIHNNLKIKHIPMLSIINKDDTQCDYTDDFTINYLTSIASCMPYSTWKENSRCIENKTLKKSTNDNITKTVAVKIYNSSKLLFYVTSRIYCKYYS